MKNKNIRIGLLEDDQYMAGIIKSYLQKDTRWKVETYPTPTSIPEGEDMPDLMIFDYYINNNRFEHTSDEALKRLKLNHPHLPVIFFTSAKDISIALKVLNKGVQDYIIKDENNFSKLKNSIIEILQAQDYLNKINTLSDEIKQIKRKSIIYGTILLGALLTTMMFL